MKVAKIMIYAIVGYIFGVFVSHMIVEVTGIPRWTTEKGPMLLTNEAAIINIICALIFASLGVGLAIRSKKHRKNKSSNEEWKNKNEIFID